GSFTTATPAQSTKKRSARLEVCSRRSRSPSRSLIAKGFARSRFVMLYDRTLIQIRERSFLDLLDLSLYVVRARAGVLALTALVGIAPWAALNYWLLSDPDFPMMAWIMLLLLEVPWA